MDRRIDVDVLVVGGGPAGSAAAATAARHGRRVMLVDKATFPRDKCCGDGLTALALRELETLGLDPATVPDWIVVDRVDVTGPSGQTVELALPTDGAYAVTAPRAQLDDALLALARTAGADVRTGAALRKLVQGDDCVIATVDGVGEVAARYVIAADGMWSPTRKMVGARWDDVGGYRGEWHAFRQYWSGIEGTAAERMHVWFEPDVIPGYVWTFPLPGGRANVGYGIRRDSGIGVGDMGDLWADLLARPHIAAALEGGEPDDRHTAWPIPARIDRALADRRATAWGGRVLFVGDAIAAVDTMTGEGIGQALVTGRLAADAAEVGGPHTPFMAAARYQRHVTDDLLADHRMSALLVEALRHRAGVEISLGLVGATDWTRRSFARWLFEDYPRALIATPRRWRPGAMSTPGAYRSGAG